MGIGGFSLSVRKKMFCGPAVFGMLKKIRRLFPD